MDNQFQKAGFSEGNVVECHGSIFHFQCSSCYTIEERRNEKFDLNMETFESNYVP